MKKKFLKSLQEIVIFIVIIAIILIGIFATCKYIIKDMTLIDGTVELMEKMKFYFFGQEYIFAELKDENFTSELEKAKNYYYLQLNKNEKAIYVTLENNVEKLKNSEKIQLPTSLLNIVDNERGMDKLQACFQNAYDAFSKDNPQVFYIDINNFYIEAEQMFNRTYSASIKKKKVESKANRIFENSEIANAAIKEVEQIKEQIKQSAPQSDTYTYSYEKVLYAHDWLIDNIKYDTENSKINNSNIYGTLVEKEAICRGYAETFKYLMDELEVPCVIVCGLGVDENIKSEKHAWNYVYVNSNWYAVDVTWDDPTFDSNETKIRNGSKYRYKYFLKGSETMDKNHITNGQLVESGKTFKYPVLSEKDLVNK